MITLQRPQTLHAQVYAAPRAARSDSPAPVSLEEYGTRRLVVVIGVMLAALLQTIDLTIVNVALPTIQGNLGASVDEATWVVTAYVIANVVVIPITPWLQRRFGRKNHFLVSIAGFTAASALCGLAGSLQALILFRIVQGAFGGGLLSTAQIIMRDTFGSRHLGTSQSVFAFATVIGPSVGPTLGGIITDNLSWQWIFDINILPGAVSLVLLWIFLREVETPSREPVDAAGLALLIVTVGCLQFVLDQGQEYDWFSDGRIITASVVAVLGAIGFVWWELAAKKPIVDLRVLRHRAVAIAVLTIVANAALVFGGALLLPQFIVTQLGCTSTQAGLLVGARALPVLLLTIFIGRISNGNRVDLRLLIGGGLFTAGIGTVWLSHRIVTQADFASFVAPMMFIGFGIAFVYSPLLVATLRAVPKDAAKAAAFIILGFQLGGSISAAVFVTMTDRREQFHQTILAGQATLQRPEIASFLQTHPVAQLAHLVTSQAISLAYGDAILAAGAVAICFSPFVALLRASAKPTVS